MAAAMWLSSAGFFLPVLLEYFHTGLVMRFPTLIVCGVTATVGMIFWICGIILEVIVKKHKQLYELMLTQMKMTLDKNRPAGGE